MKWASQQDLLESLESRVEQHIQEAVRVFQNLSEEELQKPAPDGGWSMAQCLAHLNTYGDFYLPRIKSSLAKGAGNNPLKGYKSSWIGHYFIRMVEPETGTRKQKALAKHIPSADLDAHAVVAEFIRQQEELLWNLRQARKVDLNSIRIPVSFSNLLRLKLGDVFQFLVAHNERHIRQAKALIEKESPFY